MLTFTSGTELWKGLTDLPISILALVFFVLLLIRKTGNRKLCRLWAVEFLLVGIGSFLGSAVHCFVISEKVHMCIWYILFLIMFELAKAFFVLFLDALNHEKYINRRNIMLVSLFELIMYCIALIIISREFKYGIYVFAVFALVLSVYLAIQTKKHDEVKHGLEKLIVVILCAAVAQALKVVFGNYSIILAHLLVLFALLLLFGICNKILEESQNTASQTEDEASL